MNSNQKNDQQKQTAAKSPQQAQGQKKTNSNIQQDTKKQQTDRTK